MEPVFGSFRNGIFPPYLGPSPDDYWSDIDASHRVHVRQAAKLGIAVGALVLLAIFVHPGFLAIGFPLGLFLTMELAMAWRSRPAKRTPRR